MKLIVSDASPLIVVAKSGLLPVLTALVEEVVIPETVYAECTVEISLPGARAVRAAVETGQIHVRPDAKGPSDDPGNELAGLDAGELAAIHMATALECPRLAACLTAGFNFIQQMVQNEFFHCRYSKSLGSNALTCVSRRTRVTQRFRSTSGAMSAMLSVGAAIITCKPTSSSRRMLS